MCQNCCSAQTKQKVLHLLKSYQGKAHQRLCWVSCNSAFAESQPKRWGRTPHVRLAPVCSYQRGAKEILHYVHYVQIHIMQNPAGRGTCSDKCELLVLEPREAGGWQPLPTGKASWRQREGTFGKAAKIHTWLECSASLEMNLLAASTSLGQKHQTRLVRPWVKTEMVWRKGRTEFRDKERTGLKVLRIRTQVRQALVQGAAQAVLNCLGRNPTPAPAHQILCSQDLHPSVPYTSSCKWLCHYPGAALWLNRTCAITESKQ